MADVTHSSRSYVRVKSSPYGAPPITSFEESTCASTAVIAYGQVVMLDIASETAAHRILRCSTASGQSPIQPINIVGVSAAGSTSDGSTLGLGTEGRKLSVYVAAPEVQFLFPTKVVIASTLVNTGLELSWDSTLGIHHLSANSTAGDQIVRVTGIVPGTAGDTGGYLFGRFFSSVVAPMLLGG